MVGEREGEGRKRKERRRNDHHSALNFANLQTEARIIQQKVYLSFTEKIQSRTSFEPKTIFLIFGFRLLEFGT